MQHKNESESSQDEEWVGETWTIDQVTEYAVKHERRCILVVNGYAVDVTPYLGEHVSSVELVVGSNSNIWVNSLVVHPYSANTP